MPASHLPAAIHPAIQPSAHPFIHPGTSCKPDLASAATDTDTDTNTTTFDVRLLPVTTSFANALVRTLPLPDTQVGCQCQTEAPKVPPSFLTLRMIIAIIITGAGAFSPPAGGLIGSWPALFCFVFK